MHVDEQLAALIVTRLTGLVTAPHVFRRRPDAEPLEFDELPAVCVWTESENASETGIHLPFYERAPRFRVDAKVKKTGEVETTLNAIRAAVETALGPAFLLPSGGQEFFLLYRGAIFDDSADGDQTVATCSMRFEGSINTDHGLPEVAK
jgi:hypothetical protein